MPDHQMGQTRAQVRRASAALLSEAFAEQADAAALRQAQDAARVQVETDAAWNARRAADDLADLLAQDPDLGEADRQDFHADQLGHTLRACGYR